MPPSKSSLRPLAQPRFVPLFLAPLLLLGSSHGELLVFPKHALLFSISTTSHFLFPLPGKFFTLYLSCQVLAHSSEPSWWVTSAWCLLQTMGNSRSSAAPPVGDLRSTSWCYFSSWCPSVPLSESCEREGAISHSSFYFQIRLILACSRALTHYYCCLHLHLNREAFMNFSDQATCQVFLLKCLGGSKLSLFAVLKFTLETLFMLTFIPFSFWIILCGKKYLRLAFGPRPSYLS